MNSNTYVSIEERIEEERRKKRNRSLILTAVITVVICYLLLQVFFGVSVVEGDSMEPGIPDGSIVVYERWNRSCDEDDVVIVQMDGGQLVKRIDSVQGGKVFLLGDNRSESVDSRTFGMIDQDRIIGTVVCVIRFI